MKRIIILILSLNLICSLSGGTPQWDQYLGNPGRTAYIDSNGPDSPAILWEVQLSDFPLHPFISGDSVVVGCGGRAVLIDLLTGDILDEAVADVQYLTGAYPVGDMILGKTAGGWLYKINPTTGDAPFDVRIPYGFFCWAHCHPIVLSDKLIFPSTPVVCLSVDDYSTLWDLQSSLGPFYPEDAEVYMIAASLERLHIVLWGVEGKNLLTVDSNTGEFLWERNSFRISMIATDGALLFAAGENLHTLDSETGELIWTFEFESDYLCSNIMVGPHAVYVTDNEMLYSVDKTTGALNWKVEWEENPFFWITYIVGFKESVICSDVRNLSCFSEEDGTEIWNIHFGDFIDHEPRKPCPATAEGILIVGGEEDSNKLLALASDPELFKRQGDVFLLEGLVDEAINSYKKAAELYEKKGNETQSRKIQEQIVELENLQETTPPETTPPSPKSTPTHIVLGLFILMGIFIVYYVLKKRNP
jgi:outer membrane protein assembly factor BamB